MSEMDLQDDNSHEIVMREKEIPLHVRKKHLLEAETNYINPKCSNVDEIEIAKENSVLATDFKNVEKNEDLVPTKVENLDPSETQTVKTQEITDSISNNSEIIANTNDADETFNEGIVIQIVKEKGNLKMKQMTSKKKKLPFLKRIGLENALSGRDSSTKCDQKISESKEILTEQEDEDSEEKLNGDSLFLCCICKEWKNTLKELLGHVKTDHPETPIPQEYELLLNKQRKAILNIETTAKELISLKKYKAVSRLLNSSKTSLKSFNLDLFGLGDVNIFDRLISLQFTRIKNNLAHHKETNQSKNTLKYRSSKRKEQSAFGNEPQSRRKKKHTRKTYKIRNAESVSSGFSSGDDVCLKSIVNEDVRRIKSDGEIVGGLEPEADEICLQFYAVPIKTDGGTLNITEVDKLRFVVRDIWNGDRIMDLGAFADIKIKRFEKEVDELLPEDTIFCGYLAKENKHLLNEAVTLKDLFNDKCFLSDEIRTHKRREIEIKIDKYEENLIYEDEIKKVEVNGDYVKSDEDLARFDDDEDYAGGSRFKGDEEPASSDNYDDGFNKETAYLAELPDVLFKSKTLAYKGLCKICGDKFASRTEIQAHAELHKNMFLLIAGDQFSCKMCGLRLSGSRLLVHYEKSHRFTMVCEICEEHFASFDERSKHFSSHETLVCGVCKRDFEDAFLLRDHFQDEHTRRRKFKDETADVESSGSPMPKKSLKFPKTSNKAPICGVCGRKFTSVGRLQQHNSIVHGGMSFRKNKLPAEASNSVKPVGSDDIKYEMEIE